MKILIIDCTVEPRSLGSPDLCRLARLATNATITVRRAPDLDLPSSPKGFDRIIVSGSNTSAMDHAPWTLKLLEFVESTADHKIPFLGVCFGHQILARAIGGESAVRKAANSEFGWVKIDWTEPSLLSQNMPPSFHTFAAHYDEAAILPRGMRLLAKSDHCAIQACQYKDLPIYSIQFHPEKTAEGAKLILKNKEQEKNPPNLFNKNKTDELYNPKWGELIFGNFLLNQPEQRTQLSQPRQQGTT